MPKKTDVNDDQTGTAQPDLVDVNVSDVAPEASHQTEAEIAAQELLSAVQGAKESQNALADEGSAAPAPAMAVTQEQVKAVARKYTMTREKQLKRAERQRKSGAKQLKTRVAGIASVIKNVDLKNRVLGAIIERFYSNVDTAVFMLIKRGEFVIGFEASRKLLDQIEAKITELSLEVAQDKSAALAMVDADAMSNEDHVTPVYSKSAFSGEIQIKTPLGLRTLRMLVDMDDLLTALQTMHWNGKIKADAINDEELRCKVRAMKLNQLCVRVIMAMYNKVSAASEAPSKPNLHKPAPTQVEYAEPAQSTPDPALTFA
jgi:hypothetical protein